MTSFSDIRNRISPRVVLCLLIGCLFPFIWNRFVPAHTGQRSYASITEYDWQDVVEEGAELKAGRIVEAEASTFIMLYREWIQVEFDFDADGVYTLYGISEPGYSEPIDLTVNDVLISTLAFWKNGGRGREGFNRSRIATGVAFREGPNQVRLQTSNAFGGPLHEIALFDRPMLIGFWEEKPLTIVRYSVLLVAALVLMLGISKLPLSNPQSAFNRLRLCTAATALSLVGISLLIWLLYGPALVALGVSNPPLAHNIFNFEAYLESEVHQGAKESGRSIVLLGDSTHLMRLEADQRMLPVMQRFVPEDLRSTIEVYGIASGAFSAFDYYFLVNKLIDEEPDLIIIPANQRWFADDRKGGVHLFNFRELEGYARFSEYPSLLPTSVGNREFGLVALLMYRLNFELTGGDALKFVRGTREYFTETTRLVAQMVKTKLPFEFIDIPRFANKNMATGQRMWNDSIQPNHEYFQMFHLINRLAQRHGISILYYSANQNVEGNLAKGLEMNLPRGTAVIRRTITNADHVYFLDAGKENPPEMFTDNSGHLTPDGVEVVATKLMSAALSILELGDDAAAVPDLVQGPVQ